jgi:hypothetical protein
MSESIKGEYAPTREATEALLKLRRVLPELTPVQRKGLFGLVSAGYCGRRASLREEPVRRLAVRALASVLRRMHDRRRLDLQLRCVGAPGARWWETRAQLEERLWVATVFGVEPN